MPIDFPNAKEFFKLFWDGVFTGLKDMAAFLFNSIEWLLKTLAGWIS